MSGGKCESVDVSEATKSDEVWIHYGILREHEIRHTTTLNNIMYNFLSIEKNEWMPHWKQNGVYVNVIYESKSKHTEIIFWREEESLLIVVKSYVCHVYLLKHIINETV